MFNRKITILFLITLISFSVFAKRSGGSSGGKNFSSRASTSYGGSNSTSSNRGGRYIPKKDRMNNKLYDEDDFLDDIIIFVILGVIVFIVFLIKVAAFKLSFYKIRISFDKNEENNNLIKMIESFNKEEFKDTTYKPQKIMKLICEYKERVEINSIESFENLKSSKARELLKNTKVLEDKQYEDMDNERYNVTFMINFKPKNAPIYDINENKFNFIEKISKLKENEIYFIEVSL